MTGEALIERLRAEFPKADEVCVSATDYGFSHGIGVRNGPKRHAVKILNGDVESAIATLRKWGAK